MLVVLALLGVAATVVLYEALSPVHTQHLEAAFRIDINTADAPTLALLPGIGPGLANTIVDHRLRSGPFTSLDQLTSVPGIGQKILDQIKPWAICSSQQKSSTPQPAAPTILPLP